MISGGIIIEIGNRIKRALPIHFFYIMLKKSHAVVKKNKNYIVNDTHKRNVGYI